MDKPFMKYVAWYLVVAMFVMGFVPRVYAGFSPSDVVALPKTDRSEGEIPDHLACLRGFHWETALYMDL